MKISRKIKDCQKTVFRCIALIYLAKCVLIDRDNQIDDSFEKIFWTSRLVQLWQCLLDEPAKELKIIGDAQVYFIKF